MDDGRPNTKKCEKGKPKQYLDFSNEPTVPAEIPGNGGIPGRQSHQGLYFTDSSRLQQNIDNDGRVTDCAKA